MGSNHDFGGFYRNRIGLDNVEWGSVFAQITQLEIFATQPVCKKGGTIYPRLMVDWENWLDRMFIYLRGVVCPIAKIFVNIECGQETYLRVAQYFLEYHVMSGVTEVEFVNLNGIEF